MSTPITLTVGDITLTYDTMYVGMDHGMLFQESDRRRLPNESTNADDVESTEEDDLDVALDEICFCRSLRSMVPRLELLGYTLATVKADYDRVVKRDMGARAIDDELDPSAQRHPMDFDQFIVFIKKYSVAKLSDEYVQDYDDKHRAQQGLFARDFSIELLPEGNPDRESGGYSERSHFGSLLGFLTPYSLLRALAENPANLELNVVWDYGRFVDAGWGDDYEFIACARRSQTYLVATEGKSDTSILKRAIELLRPEIQDFIRFVDADDWHSFTGAGGLANFAEGLAKIDVHNRTVFVLDNDAEGLDAHQKIKRLSLPSNMAAMVLPDIDELRSFPALGPSGMSNADINGCAAAIECYLDLRLKGRKPAQVRWSSYKDKLGVYQGALEHKDSYSKAFYRATPDEVKTGEYDVAKLKVVLDALVAECTQIAERIHPFFRPSVR
jgi:hypothetical protein